MPVLERPFAAPTNRPRWPYAGRGQKPLAVAGVLILVGSVLPWVQTPFGALNGVTGAGVWTMSLGAIGLAGSLLRWRRIAAGHGLVAGAATTWLATWQFVTMLRLCPDTSCGPGLGLVLVAVGGLLACKGGVDLARGAGRT